MLLLLLTIVSLLMLMMGPNILEAGIVRCMAVGFHIPEDMVLPVICCPLMLMETIVVLRVVVAATLHMMDTLPVMVTLGYLVLTDIPTGNIMIIKTSVSRTDSLGPRSPEPAYI